MKMASVFPSIWLGEIDGFEAWQRYREMSAGCHSVLSEIDDRLLYSRRPFLVNAYCVICNAVQPMAVRWNFAGVNNDGSVNPAWTEIAACCSCGSNSRMRALYAFLREKLSVGAEANIYLAEQVTAFYSHLKARHPNLVGSEYLGGDIPGGSIHNRDGVDIRHEDLTSLSFPSGSFHVVVTQDVFEHIADYRAAFAECRRVLAPGGRLVFSVPFFPGQTGTEVRARVSAQGTVEHLLPPEYHGNPLGGGALCFQHFGWDMLTALKEAGFSDAAASVYWGPQQGHFGQNFFVFSAKA